MSVYSAVGFSETCATGVLEQRVIVLTEDFWLNELKNCISITPRTVQNLNITTQRKNGDANTKMLNVHLRKEAQLSTRD